MAKILLTGLESPERDALALAIEFAAHECLTAASVGEAEAVSSACFVDVTIIIDSRGLGNDAEVVRSLKKVSPGTRILLLSYTAERVPGVDRVLMVPCAPEELFGTIQVLLKTPQKPGRVTFSNPRAYPGIIPRKSIPA